MNKNPMCGYVVIYGSSRSKVYASNEYFARLKAIDLFKVHKSKHGLIVVSQVIKNEEATA